jgi:hypothetical protein
MPGRKWSGLVVTEVTDETTNRRAEDIVRDIIEVDELGIYKGVGLGGHELTDEERAAEFKRLFRLSQGVDELRTETETARRSSGGKRTIGLTQQDADVFWKPWQEKYRQLRQNGAPRGGAIKEVDHAMELCAQGRSRASLYRNLTG